MKKIVLTAILVTAFIAVHVIPSQAQSPEQLYQKGLIKEEGEGSLQEAITLFNTVADNTKADQSLRAKALLHAGMCYEKMGKQEAVKAYQRLVNNFSAQKNEVAIARERLSRLIIPVAEKLPETALIPEFTKIKMPASPGNGMLSPDGKKLAFILDGAVWTAPVSGGVDPYIAGEPTKLTGNIGAWDMSNSFCWSGNGKWIAFNARQEPNVSETYIYVVHSEGGDVRKVQVPSHICGWPSEFRLSLSPDGKTLAYVSGFSDYFTTKSAHIYTIPINGGGAKELTEPGTMDPVWSPDGNMIAFVKSTGSYRKDEYSELLIIPAEGGNPKTLVSRQSGQFIGPIWSPDGEMIAFIRRPEGENPKEIWIVPVTDEGNPSGTPRKVDLPLLSYHAVAGWTPDNKIGLLLSNTPYETIYTVPAAGGIATQVTPQGWTSYPKYSPDGKRIYFRWDGGKIASVPSEGGAVDSIKIDSEFNIITALPGSGNEISPDGKTIVFSGAKYFYDKGERQWEVDIFTIPVEGGKPKQLTSISNKFQDRFPSWSPDGNSIAFIRPEIVDKEFIMHIYTMSGDGENLRKITERSQEVARAPIDWAPDGKSITYFTNSNSIRSIPVGGGESTLVTKIDSVNSQFELAWSPDGKELAYTDKGKIWIFTPQSGITKEVKTEVTAEATKLGWSPDGKKIAFTTFAGGDNELWLMANFLPLEKLARKKEKEDMLIRKVLPDTDIEPLGAPSPDGRYITFIDWNSGGNVGILNLKTKERRLLTDLKDPQEQAYYTSWSPDGKQIAYFWWKFDKAQYNLSIVDVNKAESRDLLISDKYEWIELGNWSSDSKHIVATLSVRGKPESHIILISTADGSLEVLETFDKSYLGGKPWLSPDNRFVAFDLQDEKASGNCDIYLLDLENKEVNALIKHPSHDYLLGWTPNGKNILYASDKRGTVDAMIISIEGGRPVGQPKPVKQNIGPIVPMGITQNGSFYYGQWPNAGDIYTAEIDIDEGTIQKKPAKLIQQFEGNNYAPDYSSDGKHIVYVSDRGVLNRGKAGRVLCIRNLETDDEQVIIPDPGMERISFPQWSSDDNSIALTCYNMDGYSRIFIYNTQTRKFKPLVTESPEDVLYMHHTNPQWSSDGRSIYYSQISRYSTTSRIMTRDIETGVERELYRYSSDDFMDRLFIFSKSPDGKWLVAINRGPKRFVRLISADDGATRDLYAFEKSGGDPLAPVWSRDGKYIVFPCYEQMNNGERAWNLMRIPSEGGEPVSIELNVIRIDFPSLHPDGRHLIFSSVGYSFPENNIWEMKYFLPVE